MEPPCVSECPSTRGLFGRIGDLRPLKREATVVVVIFNPPEQGQLVTVRQRRYVVTDVAKSTLPDRPLKVSGNGGQHLVSHSLGCPLEP
jgi:hypothetical protein